MQMYLADHQRVRLFIINLIYYLLLYKCDNYHYWDGRGKGGQ